MSVERPAASGGRKLSFARLVRSPLTIVSFVFFCAVTAILGVVSARQARHSAEERLKAAAEDIVDQLDCCVDEQLAFIGKEICEYYRTPEAMRNLDLMKMMQTYFVDEINIVASNGICIASTVDAINGQDQWTLANPAKFCKALITDGKSVFSQPFRQSATEDQIFRKYVGIAFPPPAKGYIQIGFERARLRDSIDYTLSDIAHDWHIGETGFFVISKTINGEILSSQRRSLDGRSVGDVGFDIFTARMLQNVDLRDEKSRDFLGFKKINFFRSSFDGEECLCTSGVVDQFHRYTAAIPLAEVFGPTRRVVAISTVILFIVLIAVVLVFTRLSDLVASLREKEHAERERQLRDLTLAKTIQTSSLPVSFPQTDDYRLYARMDTAREVGGDFYDFLSLPSGKLLILVADVSGKGIPAALFMMRARTLVRASVLAHESLTEAIIRANDALAEKNDAEMFVTAWIGVYDPKTGEVEYVNAGHNPPLVRHADGSIAWVRERSGVVLAAMGGVKYRLHRLTLSFGDSLILYTDGVTEAMNEQGELFGENRLEQTLASTKDTLFIEHIRKSLEAFVGNAEQSDDVTMLALDRLK